MGFMRGGDFWNLLYQIQNKMNNEAIQFYAGCLCLAINHLHTKGILHRDLKPENVLLDSDGYILITDFGTAAIVHGDKVNNTFVGTTQYQSPEMIEGTGHSKANDWWGVGILIYEIACGSTPFDNDEDQEEIKQNIMEDSVKWPRRKRISPNLKSLIKGLLNKNKFQRYGS